MRHPQAHSERHFTRFSPEIGSDQNSTARWLSICKVTNSDPTSDFPLTLASNDQRIHSQSPCRARIAGPPVTGDQREHESRYGQTSPDSPRITEYSSFAIKQRVSPRDESALAPSRCPQSTPFPPCASTSFSIHRLVAAPTRHPDPDLSRALRYGCEGWHVVDLDAGCVTSAESAEWPSKMNRCAVPQTSALTTSCMVAMRKMWPLFIPRSDKYQ